MSGRTKAPKTKRMPAKTWAEIQQETIAGGINRMFLKPIYEVLSEKLHHTNGDAASEIQEIDWLMARNGAGSGRRMGVQEACSLALELAAQTWGDEYMNTHTLALEVCDGVATATEGEKPVLRLWKIEGL